MGPICNFDVQRISCPPLCAEQSNSAGQTGDAEKSGKAMLQVTILTRTVSHYTLCATTNDLVQQVVRTLYFVMKSIISGVTSGPFSF